MKEQLISFDTAKLLTHTDFYQKDCNNGYLISSGELSFDYLLDYCNKKAIASVTQSLLQKWLREKHEISVEVTSSYYYSDPHYVSWMYRINTKIGEDCGDIATRFKTYEEALEKGLKNALIILSL
jgi:hypothetical protein